jgi:hypothetical protein
MAHDVFISHSSKDKVIADAVCAAFEAAQIRCWITPRDIRSGENWAQAISKAIKSSRILVLIFSKSSNQSEEVARELALAVNSKAIVIPFKIDDIFPNGIMEYYLSCTHWLDAMNPPTAKNIKMLIDTVKAIMDETKEPAAVTPADVDASSVKVSAEEMAAEHKYLNKHADKKLVKKFFSQKKSVLIAMTILIALSLLYIPYYFFYGSADQPSGEADGAELVGNSEIAIDDEWIFYQNLSDGGKLYKMSADGRKKEKVNDDNSTNIVALGDWVYYSNRDDGNKIYRIRTDGSARARINDESSTQLSVQEGWVYYLAAVPGPPDPSTTGLHKLICRIRTDGSSRTIITSGFVIYYSVINEWIYNIAGKIEDDPNREVLQRVRNDGSDHFVFETYSERVVHYYITDEWIYFGDEHGIGKIRTDGTGLAQILEGSGKKDITSRYALFGEIVVFDDWIYYINYLDSTNIYRIHVDGTEPTKVNNDNSGNMHIAENWIYYINYDDGGKIYKIRTDGTERVKINDDRTDFFYLALN